MQQSDIEAIAAKLAANRANDRQGDVPLDQIRSLADSEAIQAAALQSYDRDFKGYSMVGTSEMWRRTLGLTQPAFSEIPIRDCLDNDSHFRLPAGVIGVQCEIALMVGSLEGADAEGATRDELANAILACMPTIGLLGRRVHIGADPQLSATADFGLHVATILGPACSGLDPRKLDRLTIVVRIDGKAMITFSGASVGMNPLDAVLWLHRELGRRGRRIHATDIVTIGSLGPILQVLPGQHLSVEYGDLGVASCWFE